MAQSGHFFHSHLIQCSHSLNDRRQHEHLKTVLHQCFHIINPPTITYYISNMETRGKDARSLKSAFRRGYQTIS